MIDQYEIAVLAEDYENKKLVFMNHAMANYRVGDMNAIIAYHQAEAEMIEAWQKLEKAKRK